MVFATDVDNALAYDRWFDQEWGRYAFREESRALLAALGGQSVGRVVDVGCGTGRFTAELANRGARVVGLDLDASMLRVARGRVACPLVRGDASDLPFADESFEGAVAVTLCEFVGEPSRVFAELARVTRRGGCFVVGSLNPRSLWGLRNREHLQEAPWSEARFLTRDELLRLGGRHGPASLRPALFAFEGMPGLRYAGPALEFAAHALPARGAFQVLTVHIPA